MRVLKKITRILPLTILAIIAWSCSDDDNQNLSKVNDDNLHFSWYVGYDWWSPPNAWGVDVVSKWIRENKKVTIDWVSPSGSGSDKLNLMIATQDLTDVICVDRGSKVNQLIDAGLLLELDPYLDKLPNLKKWAGKLNLELLRYKDGKLYQFPNWYINPDATSGNGNAGWAINTKVYKQLGSPKLETYAELEAYLELVKKKFPNMVPLEAGDNFQAKNLVYRGMGEKLFDYPGSYLGAPQSGKFTKVFEDPMLIKTYLFLNRLLRKGLMTQDFLTQTSDQVVEKLVNGQVAVMTSWDFSNLIKKANDNNKIDPNLYDIIWPPHDPSVDPKKITQSGYATLGWNVNVFTKSAAPRIEKILEYMDWATGPEGQRILSYGPQGFFWDEMDQNGIPFWNSRYENASATERSQSRIFNWNWVGNTSWVDSTKVAANQRLPLDKQDKSVAWQGNVLWQTTQNENEFVFDRPAPESDLGMKTTIIADVFDYAIAQAMFAPNEAEVLRIFAEAQTEIDQNDYAEYLDYCTRAWNDRKALLVRLQQ